MKNRIRLTGGILLAMSSSVLATELVYEPLNPSFGGNPLNGSFLFNFCPF